MRFFRQRPARSPLNPDFTNYMDMVDKKDETVHGYIPPPLMISQISGKKIFSSSLDMPARYDLREKGRLTPVKDQGAAGTCWAFAAYGSLESCLLPDEKWDFSENNMKNLLSKSCSEGYDRSFDGGGNDLMSAAYLARWDGPIQEKTDPYDPFTVNCSEFTPRKHLKKIIYIPDRLNSMDNSDLKYSIKKYGAVFSSMYFANGYYNDKNAAYYASGGKVPNHAICLVGWDDNYPGSKFKNNPPGNGAFIVRNSWGTEWGEGGYFYISYYDLWIGRFNAIFCRVDAVSSRDIIHQYDPLGWTASYGFNKSTAWFANIFKAESEQYLNSCSFYTASPNSNYIVYVYKDVKPAKPRSGKLVQKEQGKINYPSYFVKTLSKSVRLKKDQLFSVVVKISTPDWNWPIPVELNLPGYSSKAHSEPEQGFISANGKTWTDIYAEEKNSSVCLKAFARRKVK